MSDDDNDKPKRTEVGYGRPPVESQFKPGQSGNKRGRPRTRTPGVMPVELTRAILKVGNTDVVMNTPDGKVKVPAYQAVFASLLRSAMSGKFHSARVFLEYYDRAVKDYANWNPQLKIYDETEKELLSGNDTHIQWPEASDHARRTTRKILSERIEPDYPRRKGDPKPKAPGEKYWWEKN
jgi:hypothetical protein